MKITKFKARVLVFAIIFAITAIVPPNGFYGGWEVVANQAGGDEIVESGTTNESGTPEESEAPGESGTPEESEVPGESGTPEESQVPGESQAPGESETPGESKAPGESETSGESETPEESQAPGESETSGESGTPEESETSGESGTPEESETSGESEAPEESETSGESGTTEKPEPPKGTNGSGTSEKPKEVSGEDDAEWLLINFLTELAADSSYTSEQLEMFRSHLENWLGTMEEEEVQTIYDKYDMNEKGAMALIQKVMKVLTESDDGTQKSIFNALLLELLLSDGLDDEELQLMVEDYILNIMTDEEAEELCTQIVAEWLSADEAIEYIVWLIDSAAMQGILFAVPALLDETPLALVGELEKLAGPVDDVFREYEVLLNFSVNKQRIEIDGDVTWIEGFQKGTGNTVWKDYGFPTGQDKIIGLCLEPGKDYWYYPDGTENPPVKIEANAYYDPDYIDNNSVNVFIHSSNGSKQQGWCTEDIVYNVWIPGWLGEDESYKKTGDPVRDEYMFKGVDDDFIDTPIYTSLPTYTDYTTIENVVITDILPAGFAYVAGTVSVTDSNGNPYEAQVIPNGNGTITIELNGSYDDSVDFYSIKYQIEVIEHDDPEYINGKKQLELEEAAMSYHIVDAGDSVIESNTAEIDVPPLFEVKLNIDKPVIWEGGDAILMPEINILGTEPPSGTDANGWDIPEEWLDYYNFENYAKSWTDDESNEIELDDLNDIPLTGVTGVGVKTYGFTAAMPVAGNPYYKAPAAEAKLTVVIGKLTIKMVVDGGTERAVTKGLFDVLVNYNETEQGDSGQFSFAADLGKGDNMDFRTYVIRKDTGFNAAAYVPYGYRVTGVDNNGASFTLAEFADITIENLDPAYTITKTITVKVEKKRKPWFRDWTWKREEDNTFDSEVVME